MAGPWCLLSDHAAAGHRPALLPRGAAFFVSGAVGGRAAGRSKVDLQGDTGKPAGLPCRSWGMSGVRMHPLKPDYRRESVFLCEFDAYFVSVIMADQPRSKIIRMPNIKFASEILEDIYPSNDAVGIWLQR